ncbi:DUF600 family protein [Virgibacillus sp. 179-BFC.A HS]|uniref:DUF600 family protein n=1 Tax=Tigheibacillus jepli TaxID=3035914 RepID=A0ABU5CJ25_9BACI|nr:immunity protein YezG family protein [Virgibacillus sp. 179-BFC.A HS]MDY0406306.1 DUF600 family protein [Virgibacillus sp. 179-BFC.A HS]
METRTMEQIYQQIANILIDIIPEDWEKVYVYAEVREGYKKVLFYYYPLNAEEPVYSLDIADIFNINEDEFDKKEEQLYDCFTELKKNLRIKDKRNGPP